MPSLKKIGLLLSLSSIKTKLAMNLKKKNFCNWPILGLALKGLKLILSYLPVDLTLTLTLIPPEN